MRRPERIVFLVESLYNRRDHERFGVAVFERRGVPVEVWDLTAALHPRLAAQHRPPDPFEWSGLRVFGERGAALAALSGLKTGDFAVCILGYEPASWDVFRALSRSGAAYAVAVGGALPSPASPQVPLTPARIATALYMRAPLRFLGVRPADLALFMGGEASRRKVPPIGPRTEELWAHALDYDLYLHRRDGAQRGNSAVFLDEYVPFHPDYARLGHEPYSTPDRYYPPLRAFFTAFERARGLSVVVAAHPRSRYDQHPDFFGGRRVERGRTTELIAEAGAVIAHASTSVGLAVLFGKPVVFATSTDLRASREGPFIESMAGALRKRPLDIDGPPPEDWNAELAVDDEAYRRYRRLYIKKDGTPELPFWEIVADRLGLPR